MAGIKEIRTRIVSVTNTQKITSAMKMVSAAKLRKAQNAITKMRPYSKKLQEILSNVSAGLEANSDNVYAKERQEEKILIVAIGSNGGLCGGFNSNIAKATVALIDNAYPSQHANKTITVYAIGKKVRDALKSKGIIADKSYTDIYDSLTYEHASEIAGSIMNDFTNATFDKVIIIYNSFRNAATLILTETQFLPILPPEVSNTKSNFNEDYIFEPSKESIITDLIPRSLKTQFFSALLDSVASEHGARMTAMHKATDNAGAMLKSLKIDYNKARQSLITNEILEIVSGANALKG